MLVQIDTAVFAFEPVLRGLQELKDMPLVDELLFWCPGSSMHQPSHAPTALIGQVERSAGPTEHHKVCAFGRLSSFVFVDRLEAKGELDTGTSR